MTDLIIDVNDPTYQQLLNGIPILRSQMAARRELILRLAENGEKAKIQTWLQNDPLLNSTVSFVEEAYEFIERIRDQL